MKATRCRRSFEGFSLVEIMIAVIILGIGLVMIAGAFPVGLRYFKASSDETTASLLARSVLASLQAMRTKQYEAYEMGSSSPRAEPYGQAAVVECFRIGTPEVVWLWDADLHDGSGEGDLLKDEGLGNDIDDWFPRDERLCGVDERFHCQVFYKGMSDPLGNVPSTVATYQVFLVVQKAPEGTKLMGWNVRFPNPSAEVNLTDSGTTVTWPSSGVVRPGAFLYEVASGDWVKVVDVDLDANGDKLKLNRSISSGRVRAVNNCIAMFRGIVSKEAIR